MTARKTRAVCQTSVWHSGFSAKLRFGTPGKGKPQAVPNFGFLSFPRASVGMSTVSLQRRETARHESFPLLINVNQTLSFCIISGTGITSVFRLIHRPSFDRIDLKLLISFCKSSACAERSRSKRSQSMSLGLVPVEHQSGTSITVRTCPKPVIRLYALNQARVVAGLVDWS